MAHNNGMVPKRGRKGFSENAAKFHGVRAGVTHGLTIDVVTP
jgi:hypothetical protein